MKASNYIKEVFPELATFLEEEFKGQDMPECFEDSSYMPTEDELKEYSIPQLEYLQMSANMDESDAIYDGGELYENMRTRNHLIKNMIQEELKRRHEV